MEYKFKFSHLDKLFWPELKITKSDLADYYRKLADYIMPYIKDRPHSLLRHPNGYADESFFQKNLDEAPDWIETVKIRAESTGEIIHYLVCKDLDHLLYMVQLGCIEINPWSSTIAHLNKPDWLIIDLDPQDIAFDKVIDTALEVKKLCDELKIPSFPKTSGKSGLHVYIPLNAHYPYSKVRKFAKHLAISVCRRTADFTSIERLPEKRRGKVYVDFLQNSKGQTLAAPYSVRPTKEATVSTPLDWGEVKKGLSPKDFTMKNLDRRLNRVGDLWKPILGAGINLDKSLQDIMNL
jgi:bifunctional non-homologous end joining protein LigD